MKERKMNGTDTKCLIAYFSRPGNNYVNGSIVNLPVGNTEVVAKMIQEMTKGDLFRIEAVHAYPVDYSETTDVAKKELQTKARPKITGRVENINAYDVILLGYPNWWGTMPMPVYTFLEEYNFSGKTLAPFCTHEGSGLGHSVGDIRKMCPESTVPDGLAIRGSEVKNAQDEVSGWLREIGMTKKN
jgi:flavodoxin